MIKSFSLCAKNVPNKPTKTIVNTLIAGLRTILYGKIRWGVDNVHYDVFCESESD